MGPRVGLWKDPGVDSVSLGMTVGGVTAVRRSVAAVDPEILLQNPKRRTTKLPLLTTASSDWMPVGLKQQVLNQEVN